MSEEQVWLGVATLMLDTDNPRRTAGFTGAYAAFACRGEDFASALTLLCREFSGSGYSVTGLNNCTRLDLLEREMTAQEAELVRATAQYPAQFKNIHLHKGDA